MYGGATRAPRHGGGGGGGGIMKIFHWEGEPQRELDTATTTSLRTLQLIIRITASTYKRRDPLLLIRYSGIHTVRHLHAAKPYLVGGRPARTHLPSTPLHLNPPSTF